MTSIPEKPSLEGLEAKWRARWEADGTYRFDRTRSRGEVFSIDTPPPTVSGTLHPGHVCSYTHTDTVARYQRMRGKEVFYPVAYCLVAVYAQHLFERRVAASDAPVQVYGQQPYVDGLDD